MLKGLNWGHRRASGPMDAVSRAANEKLGFEIIWDQQSLNGFEHGLTPDIADRYDLIVFDHPFCGDISAQRLMQPLTNCLQGLDGKSFIGDSLASYRFANELWGLPIDGATQACVYRPDIMAAEKMPNDWSDVVQLGRSLRQQDKWLVLPSLSPHGFLLLLGLCAALGSPWPNKPLAPLDVQTIKRAVKALLEVSALAHPAGRGWNAIDAHEAMSRSDDLVYCPAMYVYTTYAERGHGSPLAFAPFPGPDGSPKGTVLGGTGLGITRSCRNLENAFKLITFLAGADVQTKLMMEHHGQPARVEAWRGCQADGLFRGSHKNLCTTMESAWTRPRFAGYIVWQDASGKLVERLLAGDLSEQAFLDALIRSWEKLGPERYPISDKGNELQGAP